MLVLARKKNQSIIISNNIELFIIDINNDQVKIGIKAPKEIPVHRKEIYEEIQNEMKNAAKFDPAQLDDLSKFKKNK